MLQDADCTARLRYHFRCRAAYVNAPCGFLLTWKARKVVAPRLLWAQSPPFKSSETSSWGRWLPVPQPSFMNNVAKLLHWGLYVMIAGTVSLGITNAWVRGDTVIGLFTIPSLAPGNKALITLIENLHGTFANVLLIAAGLHALAGLVHHFVLRDNVLRRMLPRRAP